MRLKSSSLNVLLLPIILSAGCDTATEVNTIDAELKQDLGRQLFFDANLSSPAGQSCSSCHLPSAGFADPDREIPVSRGVHPDRFGNRNTPTAAYAAFSPEFHFDESEGIYFGGQFFDGRATNLIEQAKQPFLNPVEMANADELSVVEKVRQSEYAPLFMTVYGAQIFDDTEAAFNSIADAIAEFERSDEVNPFSSKFDYYQTGEATLSEQELRGLALFNAEDKGNCAACHPSGSADGTIPALFTDFSYDNLGVPANPQSPFLTQSGDFNPDGTAFVDFGLGGELVDVAENGKFKVPTLRNIAITGPYMHNGVFNTLEDVVRFYNTRDIDSTWPTAEVAENVNIDELGNLGLTADEEADIVAFLKTLTDGYELLSE